MKAFAVKPDSKWRRSLNLPHPMVPFPDALDAHRIEVLWNLFPCHCATMVGRARHRQDAAGSKIEHCRPVLISYQSDTRQTANRSHVSQRHRRQRPYARRRWLRVCSAPACISWSCICRHSNTRPQYRTGMIALGARNAPSKCILRTWNLISRDLICGPLNARAVRTRRVLSSKMHENVRPAERPNSRVKFALLVETRVDNLLCLGNNLFFADFLKHYRTFG
jgi:hypothetical protein